MPYKWKFRKQAYQKEYHKKWYQLNSDKIAKNKKQRLGEIKQWIADYKSSLACKVCGESHPACLDFHHIDPSQKEDRVTQLVHEGHCLKKIKAEIAKCDVLCSNCHRKLHYRGRLAQLVEH